MLLTQVLKGGSLIEVHVRTSITKNIELYLTGSGFITVRDVSAIC